ncbi:PREDICTED: uncharacterized protein LOC107173948 [Diuraphis noxia]|uniref:uncharacterized protein LOC107173948 n=1 Tax=Diuraphis noxia TaxID=143948 RepID=UPI0007639CFC|nr:PREDICTED: uncharacterized protein LOC107173948 [Diuraphis noxia]XP_015380190.1 PREDICTED: uncharacterized protein LOC107173948 [Diuraphis noxia]XP_015380191.1 PREDICTED: uncharacterized protein LOC107173948 [Diuraphis noxia]XP_015380192.1 PREDICTED: uncharacterized protein LOC107173948 [Diuraphis noxia]XP_015380193.1 PREDICTED: uncharacterized protein LOC107173948 [Diuraphis noxia]XP_015380194.1 PREDICTED: uncharacterized protein LOC107173948 [Diuraphis noxia]XP_015380195.1 PREDICTED: unc
MLDKLLCLTQNCYDIMVSDTDYQQLNINADTMLDNDYEPGNLFLNFIYTNSNVSVNEQERNNFDGYENNEVVQEIYETIDTDINIEQPNNIWDDISIRYLIYCWSQLRDQFTNCSDKNKKALWEHVSESLVEHGFYFDAQSCDVKWRSLKKIYMYNKTRNSKKDGNKHPVTWNHYSEMDKAIKGIPFEISDTENDNNDVDDDNNGENEDDDDLERENTDDVGEDENADSSRYVDKYQWTIESTRQLIRLYGKDRKKFSVVNQGGKHLLWQDIAHQFSKLGYQYTANHCNDKWRNLKMTYKKNKQRAIKYGIEYVKWTYFKDMDNIFKNTPEGSPELNDIITVSLIDDDDDDDDELNEIKKESEAYNNMNVVEETRENNEEELVELPPSDIWTEQATKCLIELWGLYRPRFLMAAQGKKRLLWDEISDQLRERGHNYSGLVCDRKWRLLKANYIKRREKYKKIGVNSVKWQYYHDLDRLLGVPAESISWSMDSTMCLIDCFDNHKEKFMNAATGEKLLIWKKISEEMSQNGFNYTPRACDNKWRTLKNRYNKNRMRTNRNKKVIWVYYNKIDSVLRETNKKVVKEEINNPSYEVNELDEHNYIKTSKSCCSNKTNCITELQTTFRLRNKEFDQRLKEMEENLISREKVFEGLQQQMLDHLKRSNELETQKLRLLEQLVSRLPPHIP